MTKYDIAANVTLAGLDGFEGRMPAAQQRVLFGRAVCGKKRFKIDASGQGQVYGSFKVCFGTDSCHFDFSFEQIAFYANNPKAGLSF